MKFLFALCNTFGSLLSQNRAKALKVLRARLYEVQRKAAQEERSEQRKQQIGTGERYEKIRTYNFPQVLGYLTQRFPRLVFLPDKGPTLFPECAVGLFLCEKTSLGSKKKKKISA